MDDASTASVWVEQLRIYRKMNGATGKRSSHTGNGGWLTKFTIKQEYVSHKHHYICSSGMADATSRYCIATSRDDCVKSSHLRCGSSLCTLSASNTFIPCM